MKRWRTGLAGAGIFQTIPSLALLGLFAPLMGIGTLPALTALVIYAIFFRFAKYHHWAKGN